MYLTFDEYKTMGGTLDVAAFNLRLFEAESQINHYTFNRLTTESVVDIRVKQCVMQLIDILQTKASVSSSAVDESEKSVTQQSNDGVSISYNVLSATDIVSKSKSDVLECISVALDGVRDSKGHKVLYKGVYPDE